VRCRGTCARCRHACTLSPHMRAAGLYCDEARQSRFRPSNAAEEAEIRRLSQLLDDCRGCAPPPLLTEGCGCGGPHPTSSSAATISLA
jgi:hypothetical protein